MSDILKRMDERLEELSGSDVPSDRAVSLAAGLGADAIRNWRRAVKYGNVKAGANATSIRKLAAYLKVSEGWLLNGTHTVPSNLAEDLLISLEPLDEIGRQEMRDYFDFLLARRTSSQG